MILTMKGDVGRAILECSQNTWHDEGIILSKAARILDFYLARETFEETLSKQRQKTSVPLPLLNLVCLILKGDTSIENASTNAETVTKT